MREPLVVRSPSPRAIFTENIWYVALAKYEPELRVAFLISASQVSNTVIDRARVPLSENREGHYN